MANNIIMQNTNVLGIFPDNLQNIQTAIENISRKLTTNRKYSDIAELQKDGKFTSLCIAHDELNEQENLVSHLNDTKVSMDKIHNILESISEKSIKLEAALLNVTSANNDDAAKKRLLESLNSEFLKNLRKDINAINNTLGLDAIGDIESDSNIENELPTPNYIQTGYIDSASTKDIGVDFGHIAFQKIIAASNKIKTADYIAAHRLLDEGINELNEDINTPYISSFQSIDAEVKSLEKQNVDLQSKITQITQITEISEIAPLFQQMAQLNQIQTLTMTMFSNMQKQSEQLISILAAR